MQKMVFMVLAVMLVMSCKTGDDVFVVDDTFDPLPEGIYIAGVFSKGGMSQTCYWTGDGRIEVEGNDIESISVSDGRVVIIGTYLDGNMGQDGYWIDGERFGFTRYAEAIQKVIVSGGKVYKLESPQHFWIDGVKQTVYAYSSGSDIYDIAVSDGKVYLVGIAKSATRNTVAYFVWREEYSNFIWDPIVDNTDEFSFYPRAVTVSNGKVYIAGNNDSWNSRASSTWYYADGDFVELEGFGENRIKQITVSGGNVYVFKTDFRTCEYWVNGQKITVDLPKGFFVIDYAVSNGKIYMAGFYYRLAADNTATPQACYWIDGERYDLNGIGATAIYVDE